MARKRVSYVAPGRTRTLFVLPRPNPTHYAYYQARNRTLCVDSTWNVMAHGDARVGWGGNWRGNWRMEWVACTLHTTSEHGESSITAVDAHTSAASSRLNWRPSADLNGLVRFAERRNLVSARVPSHFNWPVLPENVLQWRRKERKPRSTYP